METRHPPDQEKYQYITDAPSENGVLCKEAYQAVNKTEVITAIWTLLGDINMPITIRTSNLKAQIVLYSAFKTEV